MANYFLWIALLFLNAFGLISNIQHGNAFWGALSAVGLVLCLINLNRLIRPKE